MPEHFFSFLLFFFKKKRRKKEFKTKTKEENAILQCCWVLLCLCMRANVCIWPSSMHLNYVEYETHEKGLN